MPEKWEKGWKEMSDAGVVKAGDPTTAYTNELTPPLSVTESRAASCHPTFRRGRCYGDDEESVVALSPTDVGVERGEFPAPIGPSGCGKTTMLRLMAGLIAPSSGNIRVAGRDLWSGERRDNEAVKNLGVVFQDANLFPWLTVEKNIALPPLIARRRRERAASEGQRAHKARRRKRRS